MRIDLPEEYVANIKKLAAMPLRSDDEEFSPNDYAGGNIDDAFSIGVDEGIVLMAKEIIEFFPE